MIARRPPLALLKSAFISVYLTVQSAVALHATYRLATGSGSAAWVAALLPSASTIVFMTAILVRRTARTRARPPVLMTGTLAGVSLAVGAAIAVGSATNTLPIAYAIAGAAGNLLYVYWYSYLERGPSVQLQVGRMLPEFRASDLDGAPVSSREFLGRPTVYLFYRGNWCPLCVAQVRELAAQYRQLEARGVNVVLISPQPEAQSQALAKKFDAPLCFLVDEQLEAAKRLGIEARWGLPLGLQMFGYGSDTVLPTVIVTDEDGRILLCDETDNYRVRPEPETFFQAIDSRQLYRERQRPQHRSISTGAVA